jgi:2'-5' RNA ligase
MKAMARLRTFIAVDLVKSVRDRAVALQETLAGTGAEVKWVEPENLHVTLLFLGEVDDREVAEVCRQTALCTGSHQPFAMSVEKLGCFPHIRRPRVIWLGIGQGAETLTAIHDELEGPFAELGYRREERRFTPHITLGRVKSDRPINELATALAAHADWKGGETLIREIHVMSSQLSPHGPKYTVLSRAPLG